jgi:hypothetical protein
MTAPIDKSKSQSAADRYIATHVPRSTYLHLIKKHCVSHGCTRPLTRGVLNYERFGNYCQDCHSKARALKLSERQMDALFRNPTEDTFYETLQRQVAREMAQTPKADIMLEV